MRTHVAESLLKSPQFKGAQFNLQRWKISTYSCDCGHSSYKNEARGKEIERENKRERGRKKERDVRVSSFERLADAKATAVGGGGTRRRCILISTRGQTVFRPRVVTYEYIRVYNVNVKRKEKEEKKRKKKRKKEITSSPRQAPDIFSILYTHFSFLFYFSFLFSLCLFFLFFLLTCHGLGEHRLTNESKR